MTGGLPGRSAALERPAPGCGRQAAELASEAARAEGASTSGMRSGRRADRSAIGGTSRRGVAGGLAAASDQAEQTGPLLRMEGDQQPDRCGSAAAGYPRGHPATVPAGGRAASQVRGVFGQRPVLAAARAALGWGLLDRRAGVARLVTHHEVPFFVAVEGFARVLVPVVVAHHRGRFAISSLASPPSSLLVAREPPVRVSDQRIQVRFRCHSGVCDAGVTSVLDVVDRDACPTTPYNAGTSGSHEAELRDATTAALGAQ
jgi:hypothetical protein